jgi:putative transport protein
MEKVLRIDYDKEKESLKKEFPLEESLSSANIEINNKELCNVSLRDLFRKYDWEITFGRIYHDNKSSLVNWDTLFQMGDIVMLVGSKDDLEDAIKVLGKRIDSSLEYDRKEFDVRRIFVSNTKVVGRKLSELRIDEKFNAVITRIRRGDVEMLAKGNTVLEQGDRIRFIARREDLEELSKLFGDSYRESSTVNLFSFGLGIGLGLFLGSIEFSISPTFSFKLGYAGGPLVVALILGALRRTGPIVWSLPYSANVTLQQIGLILFLATIGVRSGHAFVDSLSMDALWIFAASAIISLLTAIVLILVGYKFLNKPFSFLIGMVANQPAILDFATSRTGNIIPVFGYVMIFPIALISKIVIAQILFMIVN